MHRSQIPIHDISTSYLTTAAFQSFVNYSHADIVLKAYAYMQFASCWMCYCTWQQ